MDEVSNLTLLCGYFRVVAFLCFQCGPHVFTTTGTILICVKCFKYLVMYTVYTYIPLHSTESAMHFHCMCTVS